MTVRADAPAEVLFAYRGDEPPPPENPLAAADLTGFVHTPSRSQEMVAERAFIPDDEIGSGSTGVAECDEYLSRFSVCLRRMPPAAAPAVTPLLRQMRDSWKVAAATPAGRDALKATCVTLLDSLAKNPACAP